MLVRQLTTHQHGCKAEVCFLMGITLPLIIPKRRRHLSFGNSLFQKADGIDKEVTCVNIFSSFYRDERHIWLKQLLNCYNNYVLYRT